MGILSSIVKAASKAPAKVARIAETEPYMGIPSPHAPAPPYMGVPAPAGATVPAARPGYIVPAGPVGSPQDLMEKANLKTNASFMKAGMDEGSAELLRRAAAEAGLLGSGATPQETMRALGSVLSDPAYNDIKHFARDRRIIRAIDSHGRD